MRRRNGFTLIELLVVIAIIGILAAIIFPVYAQAKKGAYKSSDLSNMNSIRTALQIYKADTGAFPPALLGFVGPYSNLASNGDALPPSSIRDALYPKRVESLSVFRPSLHRIPDNQGGGPFTAGSAVTGTNGLLVAAYWPKVDTGYRFANTGTPEDLRKQRFGNGGSLTHRAAISPNDGQCYIVPNVYYKISGYDVAPVSPTGATYESHYQLFWSAYAVSTGLGGTGTAEVLCGTAATDATGSAADTPRQLGYTDPPEDTIVTWNPFFRDYANGGPIHQKQDLVLFLAGNARPMDSADMANRAWANRP